MHHQARPRQMETVVLGVRQEDATEQARALINKKALKQSSSVSARHPPPGNSDPRYLPLGSNSRFPASLVTFFLSSDWLPVDPIVTCGSRLGREERKPGVGTTPNTRYNVQARSRIRKEAKVRNLTMLSISYCPLFRELHMRTYVLVSQIIRGWFLAPHHIQF